MKINSTRARPPATFRPQGLITLSTVYALHCPADPVSYRRRSWDFASSERSPFARYHDRFQPRCTHLPFFFALSSPSAVEPDRKAAVPGFSPLRKSLANEPAINTLATGCSPEVSPFQGSLGNKPCPNLHSGSSHSLRQSADRNRQSAHDSEYQSACSSSHPPPRRNAAQRTGHPS